MEQTANNFECSANHVDISQDVLLAHVLSHKSTWWILGYVFFFLNKSLHYIYRNAELTWHAASKSSLKRDLILNPYPANVENNVSS